VLVTVEDPVMECVVVAVLEAVLDADSEIVVVAVDDWLVVALLEAVLDGEVETVLLTELDTLEVALVVCELVTVDEPVVVAVVEGDV
jgi:hypothetical protein